MHLNSNLDSRRFLDSDGFSGNLQREAAQRYGTPLQWGTPDKSVLQKKDTNIDFSQQHQGIEQGDNKCNNRSISPIHKQAPSSPYTTNSPFKKITGIKKTPNGKQNSFHQNTGGSFLGQLNGGNGVITNSNFYNNSHESTLNTTDASFSQFLNQTANRSMLPVDLSGISQQQQSQQNPMSQRANRQAASMHSQTQMGYQQPQNAQFQKLIQGVQGGAGQQHLKMGTPNNTQQKSGYGTLTPTYHQMAQNRHHHSVYASPMIATNPHDGSYYLNESEMEGISNPQISSRQYPTPYQRNKSTNFLHDQQGLIYKNMMNENYSHNTNNTQGSIYQMEESNENIRFNTMQSARGHNKNQSCYTPQTQYSQNNNNNHNNSFRGNNTVYDNFTNNTAKQISQIENYFSNPRSYNQNLNTTGMGHHASSSLTPSYRQNTSNGMITPRSNPTHLPENQERMQNTLNGQIQQIPLNNQFNNSIGSNFGSNSSNSHNMSLNTPTNHKHQRSCYQAYEYMNNNNNNNNGTTSPSIPYTINVEQSIPSSHLGGGHTKSHSVHQQRSTQSFHESSINQSNFLQNSSFINHLQNKHFDSKSTFNPSGNFGSIAQNKSGFFNSQSSFLNSNGQFLIPPSNESMYAAQGNQSMHQHQQQFIQPIPAQMNTNAGLNGMLGPQYQQGNILSKGPQLQKIIDDLKENIVKDLESLTSKLYKESESLINSQSNASNTNTYESIATNPIQLAEFNIGDDKKIRFSFSGKEVITQITATNSRLKKDPHENKENIISTYTTPLNSQQFLSPQQQQMLSEQILNSGFGRMNTPKNNNRNIDSSTALHTFSSPQSMEESSSTAATQQTSNNLLSIPTASPNNIKRPNIFNKPSKLFEKGQKDNKNNSFTGTNYSEQDDTPQSQSRTDNSMQNTSKQMNFEESVRITNAQQSQGEEKLFEEFFKNTESQDSRLSMRQNQEEQNNVAPAAVAQAMTPEVDNRSKSLPNKVQNNQQKAMKTKVKEQIQFAQPVVATENIEKAEVIQEEISNNLNTKAESPAQEQKELKEQKNQQEQIATNTPQKKEQKLNTEESENAPGKQTPCFQSSKSKNSNKNAVVQKTQSDEKNNSNLTPFCLKFDNIKKTTQTQSSISQLGKQDTQESNKQVSSTNSSQHQSKNVLIRSNMQQEEQYEDELQSLNQNMSLQNKSDNLSDQDDVVLRTDNTDQLSEGSPKLCLYSSNRKSLNRKDQINSSPNKLHLSQFQTELEHIHEKECESGNSTPNAQASLQHTLSQQEQEEKKKKSQFQEYLRSASCGNLLKEEQNLLNAVKNSSHNTQVSSNSNTSLSGKQLESTQLNNNNSPMLQAPSSKMDSSMNQDHCSYRGSAKSNHSSSSSSAQNRYQDSAVSSRKQSLADNQNGTNNNNDSSYLNTSNIHNNNSFTSTPGSNLKSSRYSQNVLNTPNSNLNNTSLRSKKLDDSSNGLQNTNTFNINSNNGNSYGNSNTNNNMHHASSATNLLNNGANIRFSVYLKQHEDIKNQQNQNQGLVFDNKNFSNNTLDISNYSSQPPQNQVSTVSPINNTSYTPKQFLFKNRSNLSLFQEYEAKMKTPTKQQSQVDLNVSTNSIISNNGNNTSLISVKPDTPSANKLHFNTAQMNKLQEEKFKRMELNDDEVHTSRENPLEQIREYTNNTQENEDSQFLAFQNPPSTLTSDSKKTSLLDHRSSLLKPNISPEILMKKDPSRPLLIENNKLDIKKDLFYTPLHHVRDNLRIDTVSDSQKILEKDEPSSTSSYKQSQPASSPYYVSSRSNFYESTQKLIEDSVIIQNKKNDLSNGNISKYSYSSSQSKNNNNNNSSNHNISGCSNQDEISKRSENNSRVLRNHIDLDYYDDDDAILNIDDNTDNTILKLEDLKGPSNKSSSKQDDEISPVEENSTPEKIKKSSPLLNHEESTSAAVNLILNNADSNESHEVSKMNPISNFESISTIPEIQTQKKFNKLEDDTPSSTVLFNNPSDSNTNKRTQFTFNIPNQQSTEGIDICRNLKQEIDSEFQFTKFDQKNNGLVKKSSDSSSSSDNTPTQQQHTLLHSQTTPNLSLMKVSSLERGIDKQGPYGMKEFTFSTNSSHSLNNIPESNTDPSFAKSQGHSKVISSSIQVVNEDGCEITVSIVSHKRSSINQSKTILKKSLMGSPTSSALAKASSVKKSQRRISFKDKIEEVYNFEPEDTRSTSRSPISNKLPRSQNRINLKKEPYFDSIKKYPHIQKDPTFLQQYKNKNASNSSWNLNEKTPVGTATTPDITPSSTQSNTTPSVTDTNQAPSYLPRRESQLTNIDDFSNQRSFKPLTFTPSSTSNGSSKKQKISFLEYSKINKKND